MSKAEDRALERFPVHKGASKEWIESHLNGICSDYIEGYHQAEKDLALTWEDISTLREILDGVEQEFRKSLHEDKDYIGYCKEVLNRFNKQKENSYEQKSIKTKRE